MKLGILNVEVACTAGRRCLEYCSRRSQGDTSLEAWWWERALLNTDLAVKYRCIPGNDTSF